MSSAIYESFIEFWYVFVEKNKEKRTKIKRYERGYLATKILFRYNKRDLFLIISEKRFIKGLTFLRTRDKIYAEVSKNGNFW